MSESPDRAILLGRQPILGREQQLLAYELLFRGGAIATANRAEVLDGAQATATVIANTFAEFSATQALGPYRGFINVDHALLFSDLLEVLPPQLVVLEILETVPPTPEVVARCAALKAAGFALAMDDVIQADEAHRPLFALADVIKVDIACLDTAALRALVAQLRPLGKKLLAEKVETAEALALCRELGFDLFQGYYFARPTLIVGKKLTPAQTVLLRLLSLVMEDADTSAIEQAFKLEPGLTVNLLRLTNSVSSGLSTHITSLRHAITLLGRRQLMRWLQLLIYTSPQRGDSNGSGNPLFALAATRGRMMELLVDRTPAVKQGGRDLIDQAFMTGILSLMPTLIGAPMRDILAQLPLARPVSDALGEHTGVLGDLLSLVESLENEKRDVASEALKRLPEIDIAYANSCLTRALTWANNLARES